MVVARGKDAGDADEPTRSSSSSSHSLSLTKLCRLPKMRPTAPNWLKLLVPVKRTVDCALPRLVPRLTPPVLAHPPARLTLSSRPQMPSRSASAPRA